MGRKISNTEWALLIGALATIDLVQFILNIFIIGVFFNRFIDIGVGITLPLYCKLRGIKLDWKKGLSILGSFGLEMVPGIDALPLWSLEGVTLMVFHKADEKIAEVSSKVSGGQIGVKVLRNKSRPTTPINEEQARRRAALNNTLDKRSKKP